MKHHVLLLNNILYFLPVLRFIWVLLTLLYRVLFRPKKNLRSLYKKWAIVTGSTDGIGKAYSFELAKNDFNIVLLSRNMEKLSSVEREIHELNPKISVKKMAIDFSDFNNDKILSLKEFLNPIEKDIGILVNNVGASYDHPEFYHLLGEEQREKIISINMLSVEKMVSTILPLMLNHSPETKEGRRGAIINISSGLGYMPSPLMSLYGASKAFLTKLTTDLEAEYRSFGIDFQVQHPFLVATKMSKMKPMRGFVCSPEEYASSGVSSIGYGPSEVPFWGHRVQDLMASIIPAAFLQKSIIWVNKKTRTKAIRRKSKKLTQKGGNS